MKADVVRAHACPGCKAAAGEPCYGRTFSRPKTRHCSVRVAAARGGRVALNHADRMHCDVLSYDLGVDVEWCSMCGALRVNADRWIEPRKVRQDRE